MFDWCMFFIIIVWVIVRVYYRIMNCRMDVFLVRMFSFIDVDKFVLFVIYLIDRSMVSRQNYMNFFRVKMYKNVFIFFIKNLSRCIS